jgi:hypothetical protein
MIIRTQSQYISYNQATFVVPAYSKLLNVNYDNGQYTILYECDPEQTESKSFIIEHWESTSNPNGEYYSPPGSKYWALIDIFNQYYHQTQMVWVHIQILH